ncbi:Ribosome-recycling factor [Hondaea fermentalgiana]|uniref:Ribosome-recycling factor n=1 Tax=Hondaea fermentalgiana TaxID=2315210 RepID=A0A2R5G176_9STRA|nr:Ribosome-recycling factor [Hondaea fermentalgiana]|eukprot:GBG24776.1 Ribosome-recycling factor [Hondaea fermentalgiana]
MAPSRSLSVAAASTTLRTRPRCATLGLVEPAWTVASEAAMRPLCQADWARGLAKKKGNKKKKNVTAPESSPEAMDGVEAEHGISADPEATEFELEPYREHMERVTSGFQHELAKLRTGRPDAGMLDHLMVEAYGASSPLNSVAQGSIRSSKLLVVNVFDQSLVGAVAKAIETANMNLNPSVEGAQVNVPLPKLTKESREATARLAHDLYEKTKGAVNGVRHDAMKKLTNMKKNKDLSEDQHFAETQAVEELTDEFKKRIAEMSETRQKEIMEN